jgi:hypothetical protein
MDRRTLAFASSAIMTISAVPAWAHHSFALFDSQKTVALEGTVKSFEWTNPHSWITLVVLNDKNATEEWQIELPPAAMLARDGWNKRYLSPGEKIVVHINPLKDGRHGGALESFSPQPRN